jgi:hypothetical protein
MASKSNRATQRDQIFSIINFMGTPSLIFTLNPTFVHHPLLVVLSGQNINLDLVYDKNMLTKNERCKYVAINPKFKLYLYTLLSMLFSNICYK